MEPTSKLIGNLIAMEAGYINTNHPDFIGGQAALTKATEVVEQQSRKGMGGSRARASTPVNSVRPA
jgi:dynamin 1-like protein